MSSDRFRIVARCCGALLALVSLLGCAPASDGPGTELVAVGFPDASVATDLPEDFGYGVPYHALHIMPRTQQGAYLLSPGYYEMTCRSYCLDPGRTGPHPGSTYAFAPLRGDGADLVEAIIAASDTHPEVSQQDVQLLLWAVVSRVPIDQVSPGISSSARKLLTASELDALRATSRPSLSALALDLLLETASEELRGALEANLHLRELYSAGEDAYSEFEAIAVRPPAEEVLDPDLRSGAWSAHRDGYFIRYFPRGYERTIVQVHVPGESGTSTSSQTLSSGGTGSSAGGIEFDASDDVALSSDSGAQRLAQSNVPADEREPCEGRSGMCGCVSHQVVHIQQLDPSSCWKAAFMMAFDAPPEMQGVILLPNGSLSYAHDNVEHLAYLNGLEFYTEASRSPAQIAELLANGPIVVGGFFEDPATGAVLSHMYVISGIAFDCETGEAFFDMHDPAVPAGQPGVSYSDFMSKLPYATVQILAK